MLDRTSDMFIDAGNATGYLNNNFYLGVFYYFGDFIGDSRAAETDLPGFEQVAHSDPFHLESWIARQELYNTRAHRPKAYYADCNLSHINNRRLDKRQETILATRVNRVHSTSAGNRQDIRPGCRAATMEQNAPASGAVCLLKTGALTMMNAVPRIKVPISERIQ